MKDIDEIASSPKNDVEHVVRCLFEAYPLANWICMNASLNRFNQDAWKDRWYFVGFMEQPTYKNFLGFPCWVADPAIYRQEDEWGLFFLSVSSKDHEFRSIPIQESKWDFISPRFFCWERKEDGSIMHHYTDEIKLEDGTSQALKNTFEFYHKTMIEPLLSVLENSNSKI